MTKPKEKPIFLIQPHVFSKSILYSLIVQNGFFYFCKIGHKYFADADEERRYHTGMDENELLSTKNNFKLSMESVVKIQIETKRSPWTAADINNGTVYFMNGKYIMKFILCSQTSIITLVERLESNNFNRVTLIENAKPESLPITKKEERKNTKQLKQISYVLNCLTAIAFVWMFWFPFAFPIGAALSMLLPISALLAQWKYSRFLHSKTRNSEKVRPYLFIPILLPPLVLSVWALINLDVIYNLVFFLALILFTLLSTGCILYLRENFRSKAWALALFLFIFCYSYSGILTTNSMGSLQTLAHYIAVVENKHTRHSYRANTYYLDLSAWGNQPNENQISVGFPMYYKASMGDTLLISKERGMWGIEWYRMNLVKKKL